MLTPEFKYYRPQNLEEVENLVASLNKDSKSYMFLAGGTDVIPRFKKLNSAPAVVISLGALEPLKEISMESNNLSIGAMTKLSTLIDSPLIKKNFPILAETASQIASPQIRNQATVGGNILVDNR